MNCDGDKLQNSTNGLRCYYERIKGKYCLLKTRSNSNINMNKYNFCYLHLYYLPRRFARKEGVSTSQ